jgi:hypothetical protein
MTTKINTTPRDGQQPSEQVIAAAKAEVVVTDARGREIVLRKPNPITKLRFIDAMGESSSNPLWTGSVWPLMFVVSIDGQVVPCPSTKPQIEGLYQRLDEDGHEVVVKAHSEHFAANKSEIGEDLAKK